LVAAIAERDVERDYLAICIGVMTGGGTVDEPIGRHRTQRTRMAVRSDGREAVTHYRVLSRFRGHTYVRAQLETGRTHQIRVHSRTSGFRWWGSGLWRTQTPPAWRDAAVDRGARFVQKTGAPRYEVGAGAPITGEALEWEAPPPADMQQLLAALAKDAKSE